MRTRILFVALGVVVMAHLTWWGGVRSHAHELLVPPPPIGDVTTDSLTFWPLPMEVIEGRWTAAHLVEWMDGRPWVCVELEGELGWLPVGMTPSGLQWAAPRFEQHPGACDIEVASNDPTQVEMVWRGPIVLEAPPPPGDDVPPQVGLLGIRRPDSPSPPGILGA